MNTVLELHAESTPWNCPNFGHRYLGQMESDGVRLYIGLPITQDPLPTRPYHLPATYANLRVVKK